MHESKKENPKKLNKTNNIKHIVEETMQHDGWMRKNNNKTNRMREEKLNKKSGNELWTTRNKADK